MSDGKRPGRPRRPRVSPISTAHDVYCDQMMLWLARTPGRRRRLTRVKREGRAVDAEEDRMYRRFARAASDLADLLDAACGDLAYAVADGLLSEMGRRRREGQGKAPPANDVQERCGRVFRELQARCPGLRRATDRLEARRERCRRKLRDMIPVGEVRRVLGLPVVPGPATDWRRWPGWLSAALLDARRPKKRGRTAVPRPAGNDGA